MTDGPGKREHSRALHLDYLRRTQPDLPLVIFTIGFGDDADEDHPGEIADIGDGQFRRAERNRHRGTLSDHFDVLLERGTQRFTQDTERHRDSRG